MKYKCGFAPANMCYDPVTATVITLAVIGGAASYQQSTQQQKSMKSASEAAAARQDQLIKQAEDKATQDDATTSSAIARARQKALAASVAAQGRSSTIATGSQGVTGQAQGTQKTLIGE
jgi:hypothetical protein